MLALGDPRADDRGGDRLVLQHPARRDVGDRDAVLVGDGVGAPQHALEDVPAAGRIDEALVLGAAPVGDRRSARAGPAICSTGSRRTACRRRAASRPSPGRAPTGRPAARRSTSENETWLVATGTPSASASARWAASKLVTPIAPISPSSFSRAISCNASSQAGCSNVHQWNCSRSILSTPSRSSRSCTPLRTISAVIGPGSGHHLVKAIGRFVAAGIAPAAGR